MRYQHSFWYRASKEIFEDTLKADPDCAIAYWGIATSLLLNPFGVPHHRRSGGRARGHSKGQGDRGEIPRENEFIGALRAFLLCRLRQAQSPHRVQAYLKAMEAVAHGYPQDAEAQIYYVLRSTSRLRPPTRRTPTQLQGRRDPGRHLQASTQHRGVAHYLIHSYDYPPIADKGLDAATRYSKIAPTAPHAQHMPSHIFTRVGYLEGIDRR